MLAASGYGKGTRVNPRTFFGELTRRNVYKVAAAYAVVGWLLIQVATQVFPFFDIPNWAVRLVVVAVLVGFPIALVIAWLFELTPHGIKLDASLDTMAGAHARPPTIYGPWVYVVLLGILLSIGLFFLGRFTAPRAITGPQHATTDTSAVPAKSIAVLPFDNLSRDADNAYFAEGVEEEIITRLAKIADLKVISRSSTRQMKSGSGDLAQMAKKLGVATVLEGGVQKSGDKVRVNVQLVNARTDAHLWAESFDRKLTDIFAVESEIAQMVAERLQAKLTGSEKKAINRRPTEDPAAYQLYLKGRYFWNKRTAADFKTAIGYFREAIDKDPGFALAYAGLADTYVLMSGFAAASPMDSLPQAKAAAQKALQLDDSLGEAHASLAEATFAYDLNFAEANREFRRAIELNPNYATARQWYAESGLAALGRFDEAISEIRRALNLDPLSVIINADVGNILFDAGRHDEAEEQLRKTIEMDQSFYYSHWSLGQVLEMKGNIKGAMAEYRKSISLDSDPLPRALLGHLYAKQGRKKEAMEILDQLGRQSADHYVSAYDFALVYLGLGNKEEALRYLEKTYEQRDGYNIGFIKIDPFLDPLRGDPRFETLMRKVLAGAAPDQPSAAQNR